LVGTLRYMSPEQALAQRVVIDHRTDIYSLGATIYQLLTLEPIFAGSDRQELLRQIAFDEPTRPQQLNQKIPAGLETIVIRAMNSKRAINAEQARTEEAMTAAHKAEDRVRMAEKYAVAQRDMGLQIVIAENRATTLVGRLRTLGEKHSETRQAAYDLALALEK